MKRLFTLFFILTLFVTAIPFNAMAAEPNTSDVQTTQYQDGSMLEIYLSDLSSEDNSLLGRSMKSGQKSYSFKDDQGHVMWVANLTALFSYNGITSTCTDASCDVTINNSHYYVVSKSTTYSGCTATAQLTIGYRFLGVTISKLNYTITLSCDKDGNLS